MAQALALAFRPRYANGHAVRTMLGLHSALFQCLLVVLMQSASGGNPQDRLGALTVVELNSPRVAPLHRLFKS
ncbi:MULTISPECIES: hypothetical protein [unclassified Moorena]|uniref:hypothetical protein n=1 Tax=unclassified Moorena TaxID=2683338 RepID=UPI0013BE1693|nr:MULTISPECIES: hypothetical protein [unclassified Moorena]NEQ13766.1 hypothetical protein [Moorena sp. SIO3E2]NER91578.1 hypothetical protein [Moorena sp. SIO3A2]NES42198.1 hypothetical protein [Moorena sp. SIO2C4]